MSSNKFSLARFKLKAVHRRVFNNNWTRFSTMRCVLLCVVALACATVARAQPTGCNEDSQCTTGSYCESHFCRECLSCEELQREPPRAFTSCIRSVIECGPCLEGLVDDRTSGTGGCVEGEPSGAAGADAGLPAYLWAVIVIVMLLLGVVVVVLVYMLRNTDTFKIRAFTRTSVQTPSAGNGMACASAPQPPPPPYNAHYEPVPDSSPAPHTYWDVPIVEDSSFPLVKQAGGPEGGAAREAVGNQAARVFNNPAYVRGPHLPPSDTPGDDHDQEDNFQVHDETTMESPWTPGVGTNEPVANEAAGASAGEAVTTLAVSLPAVRRAPSADLATRSKMPRLTGDSNNNNGSGGGGEPNGPMPRAPSPRGAPSVIINVLNMNTVQQLNDVSL